jgi:starch-binding outer membrane protein, SusD/RagB family
MKINKIVIGGFTLLLSISACDNLNYKEYTSQNEDYMKVTYERVTGLLNNVYTKLDTDFGNNYSGGMLASACDEADYAYANNSVCDFTNGNWSPTNALSGTWTNSYEAIQICNEYLANYQGLTFDELKLDPDYNKNMFAYKNSFNEARLLRAYFYFSLVRQYGDVPYFKDFVKVDAVNTLTRTPMQDILTDLMKECDEMAAVLPEDYSKLGVTGLNEPGRVNKYFALALKARIALYAASPLFNKTNDKQAWLVAAQANKALLDACTAAGKGLCKSYAALWAETNRTDPNTNLEIIYLRRPNANSAKSDIEGWNYPIGVTGGKSGNCPTQDLVDAYEMKASGKLWNEDGSGYDPANPYDGRDPRFYLTIAKNGDEKWPTTNTLPLETFFGGINGEPTAGATTTGYYLKKFLVQSIDLSESSKKKNAIHSWVTFRMAEFYLNYAEAIFRYTGSADDASSLGMTAREAVNIIRNREGVKMPALPTGLSAAAFWTKYKNERMVELAFEGHRFYDLRRWKEGDELKSITQMKLTKNLDGSLNYERKVVNRVWDEKMYFFPIPQTEIMKNPNLTQNIGW